MESTNVYFRIPTYQGLNFMQISKDIRPKHCTHHLWVFDDVEEIIWLGFRFADLPDLVAYISLVSDDNIEFFAGQDKEFKQQLWVKADKEYLKNGKL